MARHRDLATANGIQVYFADPQGPWQRGGSENANGLIREHLPKGSDLSATSQEELNAIANRPNERPRRTLGSRTHREVFAKLLADEQLSASITCCFQHPSQCCASNLTPAMFLFPLVYVFNIEYIKHTSCERSIL